MDYKKCFRGILKAHVSPLMKEHGFENKGQMFRRYAGEIIQFFVFPSWQGKDADSHWFTANLEFRRQTPCNTSDSGRKDWYEDDVASHLLTERFGYRIHGRDHWYKMEEMPEEQLVVALCADLAGSLIPLFDYCTKVDAILKLKELRRADWPGFLPGLSRDARLS
jgi:hypothetical protein